jgi:hypothetical protein
MMVGIAEVFLLTKKPDFCLVSVHLKPFETCILVIEFVQLMLQTSAVLGLALALLFPVRSTYKARLALHPYPRMTEASIPMVCRISKTT